MVTSLSTSPGVHHGDTSGYGHRSECGFTHRGLHLDDSREPAPGTMRGRIAGVILEWVAKDLGPFRATFPTQVIPEVKIVTLGRIINAARFDARFLSRVG
jgi:hypothetical protein